MTENNNELLYEENINTINGIWSKRTYKDGTIKIRRYNEKYKMWINISFDKKLVY